MHRSAREFLLRILFVVFVGSAASSANAQDAALLNGIGRGKDVILITLDTTRRDHIGCYGAKPSPTPVLDTLCARSVRFDQAMAVGPVTLPAHTSIFTGKYPLQHGVRYNGEYRLPANTDTIARRLKAAGYDTAAFVSAFVLDRRYGLSQGFDHYDDAVAAVGPSIGGATAERDAKSVTRSALEYLRQRKSARPLFLWVHYYDPHAPYHSHSHTKSESANLAERYRAEIGFVDSQIGELLRAEPLKPNDSVISVIADHGESLGEHGESTHGLFIYDATIAIPWFIAAPGMKPVARGDLVSQVDFLPSLLWLLGLKAPASIDGINVWQKKRADEETVWLETALPLYDFGLSPLYALRSARAKYIEAPQPEFYRLTEDLDEKSNLVLKGRYPKDAEAFADKLERQLKPQQRMEIARRTASHAVERDAQTLARLRSLGYLASESKKRTLGDPKSFVAMVAAYHAALDALAQGRVAVALDALGEVLRLDSSMRAALYLRARLLASHGKTALALVDVKRINAEQPNADSLLLQAQLLILQKATQDAKTLLEEAQRLEPEHGGIRVALGDIALQAQELTLARRLYTEALTMDRVRVGRQAQSRLDRLGAR